MPVFDRFANNSQGVSFQGVGSVLDPSNQFVFPILRAESTTVSVNEDKKYNKAKDGSESEESGSGNATVSGE
jgi:hypothetical protein